MADEQGAEQEPQAPSETTPVPEAPAEGAGAKSVAGEEKAASTPPAEKPAAAKPEGAAKPAAKPKPPPRELPSQEEIAAWVEGADLPSLANLFNILPLKKFDALVMQIRKAELLPQHWQVIARNEPPEEALFDGLPAVAKLRLRYRNQELSRRRLAALKAAWIELRGRQPSLWTVPDLFAAMRRLIDKKIKVDHHDLLSATRDVWRDLGLPNGREQLEILWACLSFVRDKTKK